jgi:Protein of unknown function (DUF938)
MNRQAAQNLPRSREPILHVLRDRLPSLARVLEIASGTGEPAVWFSRALPEVTWQPTDKSPEALESVAARHDSAGLPNLLPPLWLDASAETWSITRADAGVAINMVHITPGSATRGLLPVPRASLCLMGYSSSTARSTRGECIRAPAT